MFGCKSFPQGNLDLVCSVFVRVFAIECGGEMWGNMGVVKNFWNLY